MSITAIATRCSLRRNSASHCCQPHTVLPIETRRYAASSLSKNHPLPPARHCMIMQNRHQSTNFFSDQKSTAEQNVYFKKEDDLLLKNLLSNHPEYNPKYLAAAEGEVGTLARDVHLVLRKHGISNVSLALIHDIQTVFEMQGWKKPEAPVDEEEHKLTTSSLPASRRVSFPSESFKPLTR